ncbi:unnamed protein product [Rotaria sp. Silwood2]|nr:unnamed protein product [Rotaria sp. Silwood2]CAF4109920.1 unnamed protein product [Rotaria sp. Silwood2]
MNRNGLVFVPREPPKRVILYPTQDSSNQQPNGLYTRAKTALVTNNHNETIEQSNNNTRLSRQQPFSSPPNNVSRFTEKPDNDRTGVNVSGQPTTVNVGQKVQIPYSANPFFRPKIIPNQQPTTNTNLPPPPPPTRDSSTVSTNSNIQTITPSTTTIIANREKQSVYPKTQSSILLSNGQTQDSETITNTSSIQDDNRRWAHSVPSASIARRAISDERSNGTLKSSEINIINPINNDSLKQKGTSATDIVISLMDTWRAPINIGNTSAINIFPRTGIIKDDSTISGQTLTAGQQLPNTPPFLTGGTSSTASNNNQNWKKALLANFQKNSRNIPTAKLFHSKQTTTSSQPPTTLNNDTTINQQQQKSERTIIFNGINNERTFQANENTPNIQSLIKKSSESLRVTKQDDNNNNIERSTSLQIQGTGYSNPIITTNKTEETIKLIEISNSENIPHMPISIPAALITAKPPANVEQQRAIITRVMIRRDFVKTTESKPPMPTAANIRSLIPAKSAKPGGLPTNNIIQVATITENTTVLNSNINSNRMYPLQSQPQQQQQQQQQLQRQQPLLQQQQPQQQHQQSIPLSQKSLLSFTLINPTIKEPIKIENNQQQLNVITNDGITPSSIMKTQQSQISINNGPAFRSNSLSAATVELRRKKEEINNKIKKRAVSASAVSNDG